jgi:hypothetical protein
LNLQKQITELLASTPIKASALEALTEQAQRESWQVALNTYLRFHDLALSVMRHNQLRGVDLEETKTKIIQRLESAWLARDSK